MVDPLWKKAPKDAGGPKPRFVVYRFLAHHMGLSMEQTHVGMFNLAQCRDAWKILNGRTYSEIRRWFDTERPARHDTKGQAA